MIWFRVTLYIVQQLHPSTVYRIMFGCALFWCGMSSHVPFINYLIEFDFIMIAVIVIGISMVTILFILNHTYRLSVVRVLHMRTSLDVSAPGRSF